MEIRSDSTEFATSSITTDHDITGQQIEVALPLTGSDPVDWYVAEVLDVDDLGNGQFKATYRLLLGPAGTATLTDGTYDWLVKVTDTPEIPVRKSGTVVVT